MKKFQLFSIAIFLIIFFLISSINVFGQWSSDSTLNSIICDTAGSQAVTKNAVTSDGGCYIAWFDSRSGNYAVYLQKLNAAGVKQFPNQGLLISNHSQSSSLVDWDLAVDIDDNAIIAFTDTRNGSNINPFAYKISPAGAFLWGADGVALSDTANYYQANPKIACSSDGNYFFIWMYGSTPRKVGMQKLNSNGVKQWTPMHLLASGTTETYDWPSTVASDNGSFIMLWSGYTGSFLSPSNYKLYSQKFDSNGLPLWSSTRDTIYSLGKVSGFYTPKLCSDGNNGAVYVWQDDRFSMNSSNCYVQRKNAAGALLFPINGSVVGTNTVDVLRFAPVAVVMPSSNETYVYWQQKNSLQSLIGVYGQKFNAAGVPQWNSSNGIAFKPLDANSFSSLFSFAKNDIVYTYYLEILFGSTNCSIKGFANNSSGAMTWAGGLKTISTASASKTRMWACMNSAGMSMLSWEDGRGDGSNLYAQNVNLNGSLGQGNVPVELTSFTSSVNNNNLTLNWVTATEKNNRGFDIERKSFTDWQKIAFVAGSGTSSENQNYSFLDENLPAGNYSYRIKQYDFDGSSSYIGNLSAEITNPDGFNLFQNYPNPFNPSTSIKFTLAKKGKVTLKVFDLLGRETLMLVNGEKEAGTYNISFNASNLTSGVYIYTLNASGNIQSRKMILVK